MKKLIAICLVLSMVFALAACKPKENIGGDVEQYTQTDTAHPERYGGVVRYAYTGMSQTFDPYGESSFTTYVWAANIFESPLALGDDGKVYPLVCNYEISADGKTIKLTVREGVCFSDGTPVTLEDVLASLQRSGKMIANTNKYLWDICDKYEIKDNVLTFQMKEYNINTLNNVFAQTRPYCGIMPKSICEKYGTELINDPNDVIGTGPYKLKVADCELGTKLTFIRNPKYTICKASPENNGIASPKYQYLDGMVFYPINESNTRLIALMDGNLDIIECNNEDTYNIALKPLNKYKMKVTDSNSCAYFFFNTTSTAGRQVNDVNLRKAIAACFDYAALIYASYGNLGTPWYSPLIFSDGYESTFNKQEYYGANSIDKAKEYLAKSNYDGSELKLLGNSYLSIVVEAMRKAGIKCSYNTPDNSTLVSYANDPNQDWDIIYRTNPLAVTSPADIHSTMYKTWNNPEAAALINKLGTQVMGSEESKATWKQLDKLMVEEVPFFIVSQTVMGYAMDDGLELNNECWYRMYFNAYWDNPAEHTSWGR